MFSRDVVPNTKFDVREIILMDNVYVGLGVQFHSAIIAAKNRIEIPRFTSIAGGGPTIDAAASSLPLSYTLEISPSPFLRFPRDGLRVRPGVYLQ